MKDIKYFLMKNKLIIFFCLLIVFSFCFIVYIDEPVSMLFFLVMSFLSIATLLQRVKSDRKVLSEIDRLISLIDKSKKNNNSTDALNELDDELNYNFKELKGLWNDFFSSFYKTQDKSIQVIDAEYFFNKDTLLKDRMNYKLLTYMPQGLVGIGLLGTFLGLTMGLSGLDISSANTINDSIRVLINGTKTSFLTSLAGMYFSIILSFFINTYIGAYEEKIIKLKNKLNARFKKSNEEEKFNELKEKINEIVSSNKDMAENIANRIEKNMKKLTNSFASDINNGLEDSMKVGFDKIFTNDFIEKFENIKRDLIFSFEENIKFIESYSSKLNDINHSSENIKNSYQTLSIEIYSKFEILLSELLDNYLKIDNKYKEFVEITGEINAIQKENREYLGEFDVFSQKSFKITNSLDAFIDSEKNIMKLWEEYKYYFSDLDDKLESTLSNYENVLTQTTNKYQDIIKIGVNDYTEKLKEGVFNLFKDYDLNLTKVIEIFDKSLNHLSEKISISSSVLKEHSKVLERNEKQIENLNIFLKDDNNNLS